MFSHTAESYAAYVHGVLGKGREHARLVYREWFREGRVTGSGPAFRNAQKLFEQIVALTDFSVPELVRKGSEGETAKYVLRMGDGLEVEMVLLPMQAGWTLCLSSQVGCRMGCAFCETGKMGLLRSLTREEIVAQFFQARFGLGREVRNVVFMGMGEPLDNYEAVMGAIETLVDGFGVGPSRITVSTSGVVDKIYRMIEEVDPAVNLAVSVNGADDAVRGRLMPVNRMWGMAELKEAMVAYCAHPRRRILVEYVLIQGRTDGVEAADKLAAYLEGLRVTVNLIPYNPQSRDRFAPPEDVEMRAFFERLKARGLRVFFRGTKGQQIMAACGQLGNRELRKRVGRGNLPVFEVSHAK